MTDRRLTPIHQSLLEVKTVAGVEARMAILNGTFSAAITMALETLWFIPIAIVIHMFLRWLTRKDPHVIKIYMQYRLLSEIYDPWAKATQRTNKRPKGFAPDTLC